MVYIIAALIVVIVFIVVFRCSKTKNSDNTILETSTQSPKAIIPISNQDENVLKEFDAYGNRFIRHGFNYNVGMVCYKVQPTRESNGSVSIKEPLSKTYDAIITDVKDGIIGFRDLTGFYERKELSKNDFMYNYMPFSLLIGECWPEWGGVQYSALENGNIFKLFISYPLNDVFQDLKQSGFISEDTFDSLEIACKMTMTGYDSGKKYFDGTKYGDKYTTDVMAQVPSQESYLTVTYITPDCITLINDQGSKMTLDYDEFKKLKRVQCSIEDQRNSVKSGFSFLKELEKTICFV